MSDSEDELRNQLRIVSDMAKAALTKLGQEYIGARESDRRFSKLWFKGKIKAQDGEKAWAYVSVHPGLCSAAFDSLRSEGIDCKPHYDNPHISFIRKEEVEELKKKFGTKWRGAVKEGQPIRFALERIVHLIPKSWDDVDRVWFLEVDSPDLRKIRASLGLTELPTKGDQHLRFHITFAIRKSHTKAAADLMGEIAKATDPNTSALSQIASPEGLKLQEVFDKMEMDPNVTMKTLGAEYRKVNPAMLIRTSQKLLNINRGTETTDDRDSLAFQVIHGPEDFFAERVAKDAGQVARRLLWKTTLKGNLDHIPSGALTPQLRGVLLNSGMAQPLEEINPFDAHDQSQRILRLGEGGIPSEDAIPDEARNVQNSHLGFVDPIRSPESSKIGVDARVTHRLMKGSDGRLYSPMTDTRTGKEKLVSAEEASESIIAFPGEMDSEHKEVRAMVRSGKVSYVSRDQVDFALPSHTQMFSSSLNLIPMLGASKGGRALMGGKYPSQSLPMRDPEAPLVRSVDEHGKSFVNILGVHMGAVRSDAPGVVEKVTADEVVVRTPEGKKSFEIAHNFPYNRKTFLHNTPVVKIGDQITPGQLLASSNYTDAEGNMAIGKNLRVAYLPYKGLNYEDASVVSESAAQRLSSEHMYQHPLEPEEGTEIGRKQFVSLYPAQFTATQFKTVDERGVVQPGTRVKKGDPLVLAIKRTIPTKLARSNKPMYVPSAIVWEHEADGVVTDAHETKDGGYNVAVKAYMPLQEGDKLAGFHGDKGVVGRILPDDQMPRDAEGRPLEILLNPLGVLARNNTAQVYEALLGKVAAKTGKPVDIPSFTKGSLIDFVQQQLKDNKLTDAEDLEDPETGRKIPSVLTGTRYLMKLHHTAEAKSGGRDTGNYTAEGIPAKGGDASSKRIGTMETNALISHGATEVLKDAKIIRGQRNDDFWRAFRLGYPPSSPKIPFVYEKFMASLAGAGVNVKKDGNRLHLFALTDKDVGEMSAGAIKSADTVEGDDFKPVAGGLFDESLTGGAGGCFHPETRVLTREGWMAIGKIVNERRVVDVLTYDFTRGRLEWKPVTNYFQHETVEPLLRVKFGGGGLSGIYSSRAVFNSLYCTSNHAFYREDGTKVRADKLTEYVLMPTCVLGVRQKSALYGTLLGDASIVLGRDGNACISFQHGLAQEDYLRHKASLFSGFIANEQVGITNEKTYVSSSFTVELGKMRQAWYGEQGKRLPANFRKIADDITLALWFFDDGWSSVDKDGKITSGLCTQGFSLDDVEKLRDWLREVYTVQTSKQLRKDGSGWVISLGQAATQRLFDVVQNHCPPAVGYKIKGRADCKWTLDASSFAPIQAIVQRPLRLLDTAGKTKYARRVKYVYDIEVADNHNYFANGVLVSNSRWSHIQLSEPFPNPTMEEPIRRLLGMTKKDYREVIAGRQELWGKSGGEAIQTALGKISVESEMHRYEEILRNGPRSKRDDAAKALGYLKTVQDKGINMQDWVMTKWPVLPPSMRPITVMRKMQMVADPNYLYRDLFYANDDLAEIKGVVGSKAADKERLRIYDGMRAVAGLGDPIQAKTQEKNAKGLLAHVFGSSPKVGMWQRRVLNSAVDVVGRATITPNPELGMDQVGLPESKAWTIYRPFIVRNLVRRGMPSAQAAIEVANQSKTARDAMVDEIGKRPVIINRAPTLHRYGFMAAWPVLVKNDTLQLPPPIVTGFGADFDGDAMNYHVPVSDEAVKDAVEKMMPSKNLHSVRDFKVHYLPRHEFMMGLYLASRAKNANKPRTFRNKEDVLAAYQRGDIGIGDKVITG